MCRGRRGPAYSLALLALHVFEELVPEGLGYLAVRVGDRHACSAERKKGQHRKRIALHVLGTGVCRSLAERVAFQNSYLNQLRTPPRPRQQLSVGRVCEILTFSVCVV